MCGKPHFDGTQLLFGCLVPCFACLCCFADMLFCLALLAVPVLLRQQVGSADPDAGTARAGYRLVMHNVTRVCDHYVTAECIQQQSEDVCTADLLTKLLVPADSSDGTWQPQAIAGVVVGGAQQGPTDPQQQLCAKLVAVSCFLALGAVITRHPTCHSPRVTGRCVYDSPDKLANRQALCTKCFSLHAGAAAAQAWLASLLSATWRASCCGNTATGGPTSTVPRTLTMMRPAKTRGCHQLPGAVVFRVCTVLCGVACTRQPHFTPS